MPSPKAPKPVPPGLMRLNETLDFVEKENAEKASVLGLRSASKEATSWDFFEAVFFFVNH